MILASFKIIHFIIQSIKHPEIIYSVIIFTKNTHFNSIYIQDYFLLFDKNLMD
jgi:hypothetical protein